MRPSADRQRATQLRVFGVLLDQSPLDRVGPAQ